MNASKFSGAVTANGASGDFVVFVPHQAEGVGYFDAVTLSFGFLDISATLGSVRSARIYPPHAPSRWEGKHHPAKLARRAGCCFGKSCHCTRQS